MNVAFIDSSFDCGWGFAVDGTQKLFGWFGGSGISATGAHATTFSRNTRQ